MDFVAQNMGYIVTALIVIAALVLAMMIVRLVGGRVRGRRGSRLSVSEFHEVDKDRRLVLIRRDDREHLLLIGGNEDLVIETGIELDDVGQVEARSQRLPKRRDQGARHDNADENRPIPMRPTPRPAVFGERAPSLRPVGRDEPKLGVVKSHGEDEDR